MTEIISLNEWKGHYIVKLRYTHNWFMRKFFGAKNKEETLAFLEYLGFPFKKEESKKK